MRTFVSYPDNVLVTRLTAEGGDKLNLDVRVEPDNEAGGGSNKIQYRRSLTRESGKQQLRMR